MGLLFKCAEVLVGTDHGNVASCVKLASYGQREEICVKADQSPHYAGPYPTINLSFSSSSAVRGGLWAWEITIDPVRSLVLFLTG